MKYKLYDNRYKYDDDLVENLSPIGQILLNRGIAPDRISLWVSAGYAQIESPW